MKIKNVLTNFYRRGCRRFIISIFTIFYMQFYFCIFFFRNFKI